MINDNKYVGFEKAGTPVIKSVGANNVDVYIDENGEYEAKAPFTGFGKVIVNTPNEAPVGWIPRSTEGGKLQLSTRQPDFTGITDIGDYGLYYAYKYSPIETMDLKNITTISGVSACDQMCANSSVKTADLSNLETISGNYGCNCMFLASTLESFNMSKLTTVSGSYGCARMFEQTNISSADLSSLVYVDGNNGCVSMFAYCRNLKTVKISSLKRIKGQYGCQNMFVQTGIETISFDSLETVNGYNGLVAAFQECLSLKSVYFPKFTSGSQNYFANMLYGCSNVTVHFPANMQTTMRNWSSVLNGFGGTNTTTLWDL